MNKKSKNIIRIVILLGIIICLNILCSYATYVNVGTLTYPNIGDFAKQSYSSIKAYTRSDIGKKLETVSVGQDFWYREYSSRSMCIHESALNTVNGGHYEFERIIDLSRNTATVYDTSRNGSTYTNSSEAVFYNAYMAFLGYYRRKYRFT